jgi:hypothetical protein
MLLQESLVHAILRALATDDAGMSLPRLGKRLGQGVSVLMRQLTLMSDASVGGQRGPGWVRVVQTNDRCVACLTDEGRAVAHQLATPEAAP